LPPWLRDHPPLLRLAGELLRCTIRNQGAALSDQRKARHNTVKHCEAAMHRCDGVGIVCRIALATT